MRLSFLSMMIAMMCACCGGGGSSAMDVGEADTDTDADADTDSDADSDTDTDSDSDTCEGVDTEVHDNCQDEEYPTANAPDGCTRTLLTQLDGVGFTATSAFPRVSRDGSTAVFTVGQSEDLCEGEQTALPEDTNGHTDVYAVDLGTGEMEIVSVSSEGELGNGISGGDDGVNVSADGRYVVFKSDSTNLTPEGDGSIFVRDRVLGETELVSITHDGLPAGGFGPVISASGRWVVFWSGDSDVAPDDEDGENLDMFVRDRESGTTEILTVRDSGESVEESNGSGYVHISDDGRYVAFSHTEILSDDDDDDPSDLSLDVYVRDRQTGINRLVSRPPDGNTDDSATTLAFAPDGSWVMFSVSGYDAAAHYYDATAYENATNTFLAHLEGAEIIFEPVMAAGHDFSTRASTAYSKSGVSVDGRYVAFSKEDTYQSYGLSVAVNPEGRSVANSFVLDRVTGGIDLVTASDDGLPGIVPDYEMYITTMVDYGEIALSGDGKRAVFNSIQYGMVSADDYLIQCPNTPHMVYLRDCP